MIGYERMEKLLAFNPECSYLLIICNIIVITIIILKLL